MGIAGNPRRKCKAVISEVGQHTKKPVTGNSVLVLLCEHRLEHVGRRSWACQEEDAVPFAFTILVRHCRQRVAVRLNGALFLWYYVHVT